MLLPNATHVCLHTCSLSNEISSLWFVGKSFVSMMFVVGGVFGREGAAGVLYAGGGGSLRRMLLKALVGTGAGTGAWACTGVGLLRADPPSEDSAGRAAMILS